MLHRDLNIFQSIIAGLTDGQDRPVDMLALCTGLEKFRRRFVRPVREVKVVHAALPAPPPDAL